ncbi:MAG: glycoside hydrolase family 5 protein, partial [Pirellulales bacterium]
MKTKLLIFFIFMTSLAVGCNLLSAEEDPQGGDSELSIDDSEDGAGSAEQGQSEGAASGQIPEYPAGDKWALWADGTRLRGANIWQAIVIPDLDGLEFKGSGPVGPPFVQKDFDRLAALGANYVVISGPGLFTEKPPFEVDQGVVENLDKLLAMIARADMFATIAIRTGPGRSEAGLCCSGEPDFEPYVNETMWEDQEAQDAWVDMWRYTAERYKDNPIVAGYKLMVEPNSNGAFFGGIYDPEEFYSQYAGTLYDWNQLYPRLVDGIREVDSETPILIGGLGWSGVIWLPYLKPVDDARVVYVVHQYEPQEDYTHQEQGGRNSYPGEMDLDYDNRDDVFDKAWMDGLLSPIDEFRTAHSVPVTIDEFGVNRFVPGAAQYMDDEIDLFERRGLN